MLEIATQAISNYYAKIIYFKFNKLIKTGCRKSHKGTILSVPISTRPDWIASMVNENHICSEKIPTT